LYIFLTFFAFDLYSTFGWNDSVSLLRGYGIKDRRPIVTIPPRVNVLLSQSVDDSYFQQDGHKQTTTTVDQQGYLLFIASGPAPDLAIIPINIDRLVV